MPGTNNIRVSLIADTAQYNAALTEAGARTEKFGATVNKAGATQAAVAGERELAAQAQTTSQLWVASRMAMINAEERANTLLRAGRRANATSVQATLDELDARHDAFLASSRAYYSGLTEAQQAAFNAQNAASNKQIESEYQRLAARLDSTAAITADTEAEDVNTVAVTMNAQAQREASYAVSEAVTGRYGRLETTMFSLGARTGLLAKLMTPLGLTIAGTAAAAGVFATAIIEGERQTDAFNRAILSTNDAAGITQSQFDAMVRTIARGDTTIGTAREALLTLAQSGRFTGDTLQQAGQAVVDFAQLTGQNMKQAARAVESLAQDPLKALDKLNEQYHVVTAAQYAEIAELVKQGHETQAVTAAVNAFGSAMHARAVESVADEGSIVRGWEAIKHAVTDAWASMESLGVPTSLDTKIENLKAKLASVQGGGGFASAAGYTAINTAVAARIEHEIRVLELEKQQNALLAKMKGELDTINAAGVDQIYKQSQAHKEHAAARQRSLSSPAPSFTMPAESTGGVEKMLAGDRRYLAEAQQMAQMRLETSQRVDQERVASATQALDAAVAAGKMSAAQREAVERDLTGALYREDLKRLQDELQTLTPQTAAYQRVADQIEAIQAQHYVQLAAMDRQYQQTKRQEEHQELAARQRRVTQVEGMENQMLSGLLSGRETLAQAERRIFQQTAAAEIEAVLHSVTESLLLHQTASLKTLALKAETGLKSITSDAAQAAAGAYKATVGIPYVGPILAPIAAATAFAAVGAFKALVSLDVGAYNVPRDMTANIHQGEMVVPRPYADEARSRGFLGGGGGGRSGDVHLHVHTPDADATRSFLMDNRSSVADAMRAAAREGSFA